MRAVMREPILNKTSAFTADPHFRHIVGQRNSTFSMREAMDRGYWVIADLDKGRLANRRLRLRACSSRSSRTPSSPASAGRSSRSMPTRSRTSWRSKPASRRCFPRRANSASRSSTANQFLDQYPAPMRAAILSVGTHVFFQLSAADAATVSQALDGGKSARRAAEEPAAAPLHREGRGRALDGSGDSHDRGAKSQLRRSSEPGPVHNARSPVPKSSGRSMSGMRRIRQTTDEALHGWD